MHSGPKSAWLRITNGDQGPKGVLGQRRVHIMSSSMTFGDYMVVPASGMPGGSEAWAAHRSQ